MDADAELRRQLSDQIGELSTWNDRKDKDETWRQEMKKIEQRDKAIKQSEVGGPGELAAEIIANVLAYITWIIVGMVGLCAVVAAIWVGGRYYGASRELEAPLVASAGRGGGGARNGK